MGRIAGMDPLKKAAAKAAKGYDRSKVIEDEGGPIISIDIGGGEESPEQEGPPEQEGDDLPGDDEPGEEVFEDQRVKGLREKFMQEARDKGETDEVAWDEPYDEPDQDEYQSNREYFDANPGELEDFKVSAEEAARYASELEADGVDSGSVMPTYLMKRFGLTSPEAYALESQLTGYGPESKGGGK